MTKQRPLAAIVALVSAGWLVPLGLGIDGYLEFWRVEARPLIAGERPLNSFPFIEFSRSCFTVAFVWLGLVIVFWSYVGVSAFIRRREA
jgi:hypothetical protein